MLSADQVVFLLDVDNTLLDNDRFIADLDARLEHNFGSVERQRYWTILAELRVELGYVDYLATLQKFRCGLDEDSKLLLMSQFLLEYAFAANLYPHALATILHLHTLGLPIILSDGDIVFQPRKIQRSGLWDAVDGRVLVYVHKEQKPAALERHYPATHYVMIDDKPQLLATMKQTFGDRLTTVFVRQGHYAAAAIDVMIERAPDIIINRIGDLRNCTPADFLCVAPRAATAIHVPEAI